MRNASPVIGPDFAGRLPPPKSFAEASALVEAALDELRDAERALERQLADLRGYRREHCAASSVTRVAAH